MVIGIGNLYRGDDGVGRAVAGRLKERTHIDLEVLERSGECTSLMESWKDAEMVILVDAVQSGAKPGTVFCYSVNSQRLPASFSRHSSHSLGIGEAIELARALNRLPACMIVYGIEGKNFGAGHGLSPEVEMAVEDVVDRIVEDSRSDFGGKDVVERACWSTLRRGAAEQMVNSEDLPQRDVFLSSAG